MPDEITVAAELAEAERWARDAMNGTVPSHLVTLLAEYDRRGREIGRLQDEAVNALVDQTALKGMTVEEGAATLDLRPPRELVIAWVQAAKGMLGDAENYSETRIDFPGVSMEVGAAHEERYVLTVQRAGKVTPHQARQAAEHEREVLRAQRAAALAIHRPELHSRSNGRSFTVCEHCTSGGDPYAAVSTDWPCPTVEALGGGS